MSTPVESIDVIEEQLADAGDAGAAALPGVGEFTRLALWMAGSVAGLSSPTHAGLRRHFRNMARRLGWAAAARPAVPAGDAALAVLAEALVGSRRAAVASVFGPPRLAVADGGQDVGGARAWYFAMTHPAASAVAVEFDEDVVGRVVFVGLSRAA